jgi:hypothetical protein
MIRSLANGFFSSAFSSSRLSQTKYFELSEIGFLPSSVATKKIENIKTEFLFLVFYLRINSVLDQMFSDNHRVYILDFDMVVT